MASNNPVSTRRFCNKLYFFSSAASLLLAPCVSLWDKRIVLKGGCCGITLLSSSPNMFHFNFSRCCWVVMTHGEMRAVSPRMSETSLEMMISLRSVLLKYQKWACLSSWERKGLGARRGTLGAWREKQQLCALTPNPELLEVWGPSWAWVFPKVMVAFEHMLSEGQKVSTSFLFFSMAGLRRMLQGDNELSKNSNKVYYRKIVMGVLSCLFDRRWNFEEQPRISLFSAPNNEDIHHTKKTPETVLNAHPSLQLCLYCLLI